MVKSKISLWRKGMKNWEACVNGKTDNVSGKNPEDAINKLNAEYPDTVGLEILYILKEAGSGDDSEMKEHVCKVCGKAVDFVLVPRGTKGRMSLFALHTGDERPAGSEEADLGQFTYKYRDWLRLMLQKECRKNGGMMEAEPVEQEAEAEAVTVQEPAVVPDAITKLLETEAPHKEKSVIVAAGPQGGDQPQVDISDCKRNRFAIVGAIVRKLNSIGVEKPTVDALRSELVAKGSDFDHVVQVSSPYVQLVENGLVLGQAA